MLASFVLETRRKDGNCYPTNMLKNILGAIYRVMKEKFGAANVTSFMEKEQRERFYPHLHNAMGYHFRLLRCNGIGEERKQAAVTSPEQEKTMRQKGVLGVHSPKVLLQTVFFYNGKNHCFRSRQEHETLHFSQMVRNKNPDRYMYYEFSSKNYTGGITDKSNGKSVTIVDTGIRRSHVAILDLYFEKVPQANIESDSLFYLYPLPFVPLRKCSWFFNDPFPPRYLASLVKNMTSEASLEGNYTNHSSRATGTTMLFDT